MEIWALVAASVGIVATGLVAGTVFAYSNSVMPGLRKADDRTMVTAIRLLTSSVANPVFLIISNLALVAQIAFVVLAFVANLLSAWVGIAALVLYAATQLITFAGNLPLNKAIINGGEPTADNGWHGLRTDFEDRWTMLNHWRVVTAAASTVLLVVAVGMM
ncbi:DUF1772 domain-containing protein [Brevibacterium spongiae]|uniref:DUF1772 domain-containing protein n=1 Tax=Brevibacterium spongiae TaxID=2909672 RepID=A0ABY5SPE2_9MICO|nr:DUF1772 domain-containing protein [Brevibacterium spongiae]UVI36044.1 DUF1772 domain-containing protein [Brevibacterium spongiae]